nr:hypothetical protein [Tanacetum cinerariifolium]
THSPSGRFVVLSSSSADINIPTSPQVVLLVSSAQSSTNVHVTEPASNGRTSSVPELEARDLSATPSQGSSADDFYDFNINSAQQVCMVFELRLRYEHEIMTREKYEKKFTVSAAMVQQRDAKIVDLKARLEKSEAEGAKVVELHKRVSDLEVVVVIKVGEFGTLNTQNAGLLKKVFTLELVPGELDGKVAQLIVDCDERHFLEQAAKLDACIAEVRRDMDNDLYPHMLTAIVGKRWVVEHGFHLAVHKCARFVECCSTLGKFISMAINKGIQQGLEAGVVHSKDGRSLTQIEDYNPKIEGNMLPRYSLTGSYTLTVINASLTENNLHQQCKLFSRGNSLTQQWEHFFTSSGKIALEVGTILQYQWQNILAVGTFF